MQRMTNRTFRLRPQGARKLFPILGKRIKREPLVYLDAAATSQRPERVLEAMGDYYRSTNANARQEGHELGKRSKRVSDDSRKTVARYIGAQSEEVVWVKGATEGINLVARAWGEEHVGASDNIVVSVI